jgi:hypothetical protein
VISSVDQVQDFERGGETMDEVRKTFRSFLHLAWEAGLSIEQIRALVSGTLTLGDETIPIRRGIVSLLERAAEIGLDEDISRMIDGELYMLEEEIKESTQHARQSGDLTKASPSTIYGLKSIDGDRTLNLDFSDFQSAVKGCAILDAETQGASTILQLTENLKLNIETLPDQKTFITIQSTYQPGQSPAIPVQVISNDEQALGSIIESRLFALRQLYAMAYLLENSREDELGEYLYYKPNSDLEEMLEIEERLKYVAAAPGSLWLTITTIGKFVPATMGALATLSLLFSRPARIELVQMGFEQLRAAKEDIANKRMEKLIKLTMDAEKIKNPEHKAAFLTMLGRRLSDLGEDYNPADIANMKS